MSNEDIKTATAHDPLSNTDAGSRRRTRRAVFGVAAIAILALGIAGGAGAMRLTRPSVEMAPMTPVAISSLPDGDLVTVKGRVAEIFGNKFVVEDGSGRALVETGPAGDNGKLVAAGEEISVQGRFDDGFLHASFIVHPDGKTEAVGHAGGPPHPGDDRGPHGDKHGDKRGPHGGPGEEGHGPGGEGRGPHGDMRGPGDDGRGPPMDNAGPDAPPRPPAPETGAPAAAPVPPKV
jgi:uncharacterized protein YdeI (BOF family)